MRADRAAFFVTLARRAGPGLCLSVLSAVPAVALAQGSGAGGAGLPLLVGQSAGGTAYSVPIDHDALPQGHPEQHAQAARARITAIAANTAKTVGTWVSKHFGGSNAPVHLARDSVLDVDINLTGGSTPTADYTIVLWALVGEA